MSGTVTRVAYLALQAMPPGSASHAHVLGIVGALGRLGYQVDLFRACYADGARPGAARRLVEFVRVQARLVHRLRSYDVLYVRAHFAALPAVLAARILHVPVVEEINGMPGEVGLVWRGAAALVPLVEGSFRAQFRLSRELIAVTAGLLGWAQRVAPGRRGSVIPNGVDETLFRPDADTSLALPPAFAAFVGHLAPWQGIRVLLAATAADEWPAHVRLVVVGDGPERPLVESAAGGRVMYAGQLPPEQIPGILARSLAAISPQPSSCARNGTGVVPLKLYEAMASGTPVVVSDLPGQGDLVRARRCGLAVPPDDPAALARAVAALAARPALRSLFGRAGRAAACQTESWMARGRDTAAVLDRVTRGRPSSRSPR